MGDILTPTELRQLVHRQHIRIRTVAVSFRAAVHSARRDLEVGPAERDALIETWRSWCLSRLDEYDADYRASLEAADDAPTRRTFEELRVELAAAREEVRAT